MELPYTIVIPYHNPFSLFLKKEINVCLFCSSFVCISAFPYIFKPKVHCWSAVRFGRDSADYLPYYTPLVCVSDVIRGLSVCQWRHNKPKTKNPSFGRRPTFCKIQDNLKMSFIDTSRNFRIMSHVGHLRRTPEFVRGNWIEKKNNLAIVIP